MTAIRYYPNARFPQLDRDAPDVPPGLQPCEGVEYGCGRASCPDCYEAFERGAAASRERRRRARVLGRAS